VHPRSPPDGLDRRTHSDKLVDLRMRRPLAATARVLVPETVDWSVQLHLRQIGTADDNAVISSNFVAVFDHFIRI